MSYARLPHLKKFVKSMEAPSGDAMLIAKPLKWLLHSLMQQ
jgi:hypothetical protein